MKTCTKCLEEKPLDEFHNDKSRRDGKRDRCKTCARISTSKYYSENKEKVIENAAKWQKDNKERYREISSKSYYKNIKERRVKGSHYSALWAKNNPDKCRDKTALRAARKLELDTGNVAEWSDLLDFYGDSCMKCGSSDVLTLDHIKPMVLGGLHDTYNFQILCKSCNSSKGARNSTDYRSYPKLIAIIKD